ncbi:MAG: RdgB/HAM1 family non-canonical purine NTP pyrophosphatase [Bacteroidetes bacterium]|nr:RdgB/HAM1 family non-canonical purine NTP pyrophosphatase [Bacteroidota bacterium]
MEIVLATGNKHKKQELSQIITSHLLLLPEDIGISFFHEETADTFIGNSMGKAQALFTACRKPVLADDSGLIVPALNGGEPGIYSARYGSDESGHILSDTERNLYLLNNMRTIFDRSAFFVCCMTLILDEYRVFTVQETFHGEIISNMEGTGGFGYDPIFYIPELGKTAAQLSESEKNSVSHRGKAGIRMAALLHDIV